MNDLDWLTVRMLRNTSSREALDHYYRAEWAGLPAYDVLPSWVADLQPRDRIKRCPCGAHFAVLAEGHARTRCSRDCGGRSHHG